MKNCTRIMLAALAVVFVTTSAASAFAAKGGVGSVATAKEQTRKMSVTFSPLRLLSPMVRLTGEFKADDQWSIAGTFGFGSYTEGEDAEGNALTHDAWEAGGQARYYALGGFDHGLHLGLDALFRDVPVETTGLFSEVTEGTGRGLAIGPMVGYKVAAEMGLTLDVQAGLRYDGFNMLADAETHEDLEEPAPDQDLHPMVNVNVGWSF